MKLGVSSYSYAKYLRQSGTGYTDICDLAKQTGFQGIEFIQLSLEVQQAESTEALARTIRAHCDQIGLPIVAYTVAADFLNHGPEEAARIERQVDIAAILGAGVLRHDACWQLPEGIDWREAILRMKDAIGEVTRYAARLGIRTCTENHGYILQDAERVEALIRAVDHPNYGWLVDMGNFLCADETALHALPIAAPYAFHAHAKDFLYKPQGEKRPSEEWFPTRSGSYLRGTVAGHGVVPIPYCLEVLRAAGYDGWLSYEFEGMEDNLPAIAAGYHYLRSLI
ncbi:MAG: sugar phosphate isomerase/epimerase family protein [Christensenellales bacterium]